MILDCGATKTVAGTYWLKNFKEIADDETKSKMKIFPEKRTFRFGDNVQFPSKNEIDIPIRIGNL